MTVRQEGRNRRRLKDGTRFVPQVSASYFLTLTGSGGRKEITGDTGRSETSPNTWEHEETLGLWFRRTETYRCLGPYDILELLTHGQTFLVGLPFREST